MNKYLIVKEKKYIRPEELLDYVIKCANHWHRPAGMDIMEISIDYKFNKAGGVRVDAVYHGCRGYVIIPFTDIEYIGEPAVFNALLSLRRGLVRDMKKVPGIKRVIFNDPATIVFWSDNTKTIVKAENEIFDAEKGLAMAIIKKALGNKGNYYNEFKKYLQEVNLHDQD